MRETARQTCREYKSKRQRTSPPTTPGPGCHYDITFRELGALENPSDLCALSLTVPSITNDIHGWRIEASSGQSRMSSSEPETLWEMLRWPFPAAIIKSRIKSKIAQSCDLFTSRSFLPSSISLEFTFFLL